ncbi:transposase [Clostridium novyi A str. 4552]|uniref:Transposase n=1 Tax=Clostridium novyi A str. 4552 TaxID=1444289 RepID=A0A0A0HZS4_CLONO|nr:IS110 family transposase [Clostridium novyi]KGM93581.1 transposase [Clostridium novyi A str. 4552]
MSKFFYSPTVGIDVSADFSMVAILAPNGVIYRKAFKIKHDVDGFNHLVKEIKKVEKEFNMKTGIFMESTGVYHLSLFHFLKTKNLEVYVINPLVTNSIKNNNIRKVKNDKKDALTIAKIGKFQNIKAYSYFDVPIFTLKSLCRDYYKLVDTRSTFKKKLSADLRIVFPGYNSIFSDITGVTSIAILKCYQTPQSILDAPKEDIMKILKESSKKDLIWCNNTYIKLIKAASNAKVIAISSLGLSIKITINIETIENFNKQIELILKELENVLHSNDISSKFKQNILLLMSIPGVGFISAVTILTEIGDFQGFLKPKQLVAYFGIDPSVNESGKFKSDKDKISKRGTRFGRRALYAVALASIRTKRTGEANNKILLDYYKNNLNGKKKKVALVAIMHKLIKYIFAVLRNQKEYEQRLPKLHHKMYLENTNNPAA